MSSTDKIAKKFEEMLQKTEKRKYEIEAEALECISQSKIRLMKKSPFYASLVFRMPFICNYSITLTH